MKTITASAAKNLGRFLARETGFQYQDRGAGIPLTVQIHLVPLGQITQPISLLDRHIGWRA